MIFLIQIHPCRLIHRGQNSINPEDTFIIQPFNSTITHNFMIIIYITVPYRHKQAVSFQETASLSSHPPSQPYCIYDSSRSPSESGIFFTIIGVIAPPAEKTNQRTDFQCTFDPEPFSCETPTRFVSQERTRTLLQYHDLRFVSFRTIRKRV